MAKYSDGLEDSLDIPYPSVRVLEKRYLTKDSSGKLLETGEDMFRRVAKDISVADALYLPEFKSKISSDMPNDKLYKIVKGNENIQKREKEFFEIMKKGYFLPNSPTLMNAGKKLQQLSACFVLPIEDSIKKIFETKTNMALVHKSGGGTGFSFSRLRANGAYINSTNGYSPGPISFLLTYNEDAEQITQGGKRRGANMGTLEANHPDALCWVKIKQEEGVAKNFNLSIAFTDKEMEAVKNDGYILMEDPRKGVDYTIENARNRTEEISFGKNDKFKTSWKLSENEKSIIDTYSGDKIGKVEKGKLYIKARSLFDSIVDGGWKKGEPGIVFIDRINEDNPTSEIGKIESTNPCGEQPLLPYESCNLGSINLSKMVDEKGEINESRLEKTVRVATRFLDNVIDRTKYPLKEIAEMTKANRKIGLGIMGFAHMLVKTGISYNSSGAIEKAEDVMKFINDISKDESRKLAKERGSFPNFNKSIYKNQEPIRNATRTTIAPTGTIGVIASVSQGGEPIYDLIVKRNVKHTIGEDLIETDRVFEEYLQEKELYDSKILRKMVKDELKIDDLLIPKSIKDEIKRLFVTAHNIPFEQHIKVQAAFQKYTDNAVSKTINFPNDATKEDIEKAYWMAYNLRCKGVTVYRDGSRVEQLLTTSAGKNLENKVMEYIKEIKNGERPEVIGKTIKQKTPYGNAFITLNVLEENTSIPYETFIEIGKGGKDISAIAEGYGRLASLAFKEGVPIKEMIEQLDGIGGETQTGYGKDRISSLPDALVKGWQEAYNKLNEGKELKKEKKKYSGNLCPECGNALIPSEGCQLCPSCGYSKC